MAVTTPSESESSTAFHMLEMESGAGNENRMIQGSPTVPTACDPELVTVNWPMPPFPHEAVNCQLVSTVASEARWDWSPSPKLVGSPA